MGAEDAADFLIQDHGDTYNGDEKPYGFRKEFAEDKPYRSLLQRNDIQLDQLLEKFDWKEDDAEWSAEYDKQQSDNDKLIKYRRRVYFEVCGWRELNEDFGRGDVSCLRDLRTPLVTSRTPLRISRDEFSENKGGA